MPVDLLNTTFSMFMRHTDTPAYDAILKLFESPKTPSIEVAAMYTPSLPACRLAAAGRTSYATSLGLTSLVDVALQACTFDMVLSNVRNMDLFYFFRALCMNTEALYALREFFEANYHSINKRLETTFLMKYIIQSVYSGFGKEKDRVKAEAFFKDKDTRKYNQALAQALDGISAKAVFIERSTPNIVTWLEKHRGSWLGVEISNR
ncbi:ERAP1-like C-terminal domain-containing protein [Lactarius psammicola]|nr:ERAP1-like C-terminal domain-containing protein [Lactarius psammicola]